jgi:hypothetical protein
LSNLKNTVSIESDGYKLIERRKHSLQVMWIATAWFSQLPNELLIFITAEAVVYSV